MEEAAVTSFPLCFGNISEGKGAGLAILFISHHPALKNPNRKMKACGNQTIQLNR